MKKLTTPVTIVFLGMLWSCGGGSVPSGQTATVTLKDGTSFAGNVSKNDTGAITLVSPNGESRTYPMTQVTSVQYGNSAPPAPSGSTSAPADSASQAPAPAAPPVQVSTLPAGTTLSVRASQTIDAKTASAGQTYPAVVAHDVIDDQGRVAIPKGADASLVVREAAAEGRVAGRSELVIDVGSVSVAGRTYRLETGDFVEKGREGVGANRRTAEFTGGGAALGGIIGAIAGHGKGAAIGLLSGAAAGAGTQVVTRGKNVRVPAKTVLDFKLEAPVTVRIMQ